MSVVRGGSLRLGGGEREGEVFSPPSKRRVSALYLLFEIVGLDLENFLIFCFLILYIYIYIYIYIFDIRARVQQFVVTQRHGV